ncbi:hypothetical protein Prudu_019808 [Prunus dulcis]|uniref:Uncharacterized protein n=1 Tax=Prunus dulcis TaxID=3755 RepID=A0A4Y1RV18_PRUDU|nr:hypothetical protein Prudu_019808 [Prunus dulcis]
MLKTHVFTHHPPFHQLPNGSHASGFLKTPILCLACKRFPNDDAINSKQHRTGHSVTEKKEKRHRYTSHRVKSRKHSSTASARMPSGTYLPILSRHQCLIAVLNNGAGTSETLFARFNGFADKCFFIIVDWQSKSLLEPVAFPIKSPKSIISDLLFTYLSVGKQRKGNVKQQATIKLSTSHGFQSATSNNQELEELRIRILTCHLVGNGFLLHLPYDMQTLCIWQPPSPSAPRA